MNNQNVGKIAVNTGKNPNSCFNFSHDINATMNFGEVTPTFCAEMMPDSKLSYQNKKQIRLAPLSVPTFGRIRYDEKHLAVSYQAVWDKFNAFLAKRACRHAGGTCFVGQSSGSMIQQNVSAYSAFPTTTPHISLCALSRLALVGCRLTAYCREVTVNDSVMTPTEGKWISPNYSASLIGDNAIISRALKNFVSTYNIVKEFSSSNNNPFGDVGQSMDLNLNIWSSSDSGALAIAPLWVPCNLTTVRDCLGNNENRPAVTISGCDIFYVRGNRAGSSYISDAYFTATLTDGEVHKYQLGIAFKLSSAGKRIHKILTALGYDFDIRSSKSVSLLPLMAWYRGYFDLYGLERNVSYEDTDFSRLVTSQNNTGAYTYCTRTDVNDNPTDFTVDNGYTYKDSYFWKWVVNDLFKCFATEAPTFTSVCEAYLNSSPTADGQTVVHGSGAYDAAVFSDWLNSNKINPSDCAFGIDSASVSSTNITGNLVLKASATGTVMTGTTPTYVQVPSTAGDDVNVIMGLTPRTSTAVNSFSFGALDLEFLKRLTRVVNRNTLCGQSIEKILRENGLGEWVDSMPVRFIGSFSTPIQISEIASSVDNEASGGMALGEFAGKSVTMDSSKPISYSTDRYCQWCSYCAVVTESGYINQRDINNYHTKRNDFYQPELDGLGYEAVTKADIVPQGVCQGYSFAVESQAVRSTGEDITFGFMPTYSRMKKRSNKLLGDFRLHSKASTYEPFTLDKIIDVNEPLVISSEIDESNNVTTEAVPVMTYSDLPVAGEIWRYINMSAWQGQLNRIFKNSGEASADTWIGYSRTAITSAFYFYTYDLDDNFIIHNINDVKYFAPMKPIERSFMTYDESAPINGAVSLA